MNDLSETRTLTTLLQTIAEAVVTVEADGSITRLNPAAERLFGQTAAQVVGRPLGQLHAALGDWLGRAQAGAHPVVFDVEIKAGRPFSATLTAVPGEAGAHAGWLIVLQEITHLRRVEEWNAEAIQAATHDLRNPLNLMNGALNLLNDTLKQPSPEQRECLLMMRSGLDRMGGLVEQLLNLDQVNGRSEMAFAGLELNRVARQVTTEFHLAAEEKGLQLLYSEALAGGRVTGDDSWLHRALSNLVNNAIKYTPRGGQVRVQYREADGQAICEVADTGPGIAPAAQTRLFERFYRAPGELTRRTPGTGLGLAIVKAIVERHSGRVWVSSEEGRGSVFGISIPLFNPADATAAPSKD